MRMRLQSLDTKATLCCAVLVALCAAGFLPLAMPAAVPAGPIKWYILAAANLPPYADGTAMVGDTLTYTWSRFHGVVLSTSPDCTATALFQPVPGGADSASGAANVTFMQPSTFYVICPVGTHCAQGQIQKWTVSPAA
ncbi:g2518 [Coccomyxa elongata]